MATHAEMMSAVGVPALLAAHGAEITYTPDGEAARPVTVVLGPALVETTKSDGNRVTRTTRTVSADTTATGIPSPSTADLFVVDGQNYRLSNRAVDADSKASFDPSRVLGDALNTFRIELKQAREIAAGSLRR